MKRSLWVLFIAAGFLPAAVAFGQAEKTLNKCQATAGKETRKYVDGYIKAVGGGCLDQISKAVIAGQNEVPAGAAADAAGKCQKAFNQLVNTTKPEKTLSEKLETKIGKACDPGLPDSKVEHTEADILGTGALAEQIEAGNLNSWCGNFGGDGSLGDLDEWVSCLTTAATCEARQALATQYPRMLEWLNAVKPAILGLDATCGATCGSCTDQAVIDACNGLVAVELAVDGSSNDNLPNLACGPGLTPGVDSILLKTGQTQCDQGGGTLGSCPGSPARQDAAVGAGLALSYTGNSNGTVTDNVTGLMWEKLDRSSSDYLHQYDMGWAWYDAFNHKIKLLNGDEAGCLGNGFPAACCSGTGTGSCSPFAGYTDWRMPNLRELQSIADYGRSNPAVNPVFHTGCTGGCTVLTCSCTFGGIHWSSTTRQGGATNAWDVSFSDGSTGTTGKSNSYYGVRAVRGGL